MTPKDHPHLPQSLEGLATSHRYRFQLFGELNDLESAAIFRTRALALTPDDHPKLSSRLANLAVSHSDRFERLGELNDLEKAIQYKLRALDLTPDGHPDMSQNLANLAVSYKDRFERLGELVDLGQSIQYGLRALTLTPDDDPNLSTRYGNQAVSHKDRFLRLGELSDLEQAIEYELRALALTPDGHPHLPSRFANLAGSHTHRFQLLDELSDLEQAIKYGSHALTLTPDDRWYPHLTTYLDAASAAILSSNYSLALEWLEHARCVVWNQHLMLRSPLEQLQASHPCLAIRLQTVANQLHSAGSESRDKISSSGSMNQEQVGQEHRRLAKEYNDLLTQTRALPEFEDFLRPMKVAGLLRAAKNGPIVVINCHKDRCDALLVLPEESNIAHLPLPNFTREKAQATRARIEQSLSRHGLRERGVHIRREPGHKDEFGSALAILWNDVVKPILDYLGYTSHAQTESLPHITWCPTGAASFLPLHAAGDYDQPHSRIFEYAVSSFTPTITALLASTSSNLGSNSRVLAIGQEVTPGHRLLPGSATELAYIKSHVGNRVGYSQLMDAQATPSTVLDAMEQHDWVHLACHAHQNVYDPTMSGFFLHGGTLDLASINRRTFKKKGLAFLSACQTAKGDERLPDEAVHLASGMLMAGYSSVIATMWSVVDQDAPFVADKVYGQLMIEGKVGNGEAGKALHNAIAGLREKIGEKEFGRWVPYIHIGS
ncbi:unnamed protein product [Rhizoctonia solani]|uniref:CHAT domain-containing protein n=1 Tax=Rhizoctonia solani TaxID=456999 RepID=A0A8H3D3K4_9AGAM|nr:unnamed protein product [Rhizoctonia solani]